jgi:hypothetical protein
MPFPDSYALRDEARISQFLRYAGRPGERGAGAWGPFETIGDFIRADQLSLFPATLFCGGVYTSGLSEFGLLSGNDDDGDGIIDERDERDIVFTWIANHFTTRANVFDLALSAEICDPPFYPGRKLPFMAYKSKREHARKQLLAILDRSTILRVNPDGSCDFSGPIGVRMLRMTDDLRVY